MSSLANNRISSALKAETEITALIEAPVLYKGNIRKPICRMMLDTKKKQILIPDENKDFTRYYINSLNDIYSYRDELMKVVSKYIEN